MDIRDYVIIALTLIMFVQYIAYRKHVDSLLDRCMARSHAEYKALESGMPASGGSNWMKQSMDRNKQQQDELEAE